MSAFLIYFWGGTSFRSQGYGTLRELIARGRPAREESEWLERELALLPRWREGFAVTLRAEYRFTSQAIDGPPEDGGLGFDLFGAAGEEPAVEAVLRPLLKTRLFFNPELTRRLFAEGVRSAIGEVLRGASSFSPELPRLWWGPLPAKNYQGKRSCWMALDYIRKAFERSLEADFEVAALRAFLGLRRHYLERKSLPASLEDLVPAYLSRVPLDLEGLPIGYDPEARTLFARGKAGSSVGKVIAIEFDPPLRESQRPSWTEGAAVEEGEGDEE